MTKDPGVVSARGATEMAGRLAGRVCVITGTGGSMGRAAGGEMVSPQPCRPSDPAECARLVEPAVDDGMRVW